MDNETIKKILDLAVLAPSGDNVQPWRFEMKEGKLSTFIVPEQDISPASAYLSHGAMLENLIIATPGFGWLAKCNFFTQGGKENLVAEVSFEKISSYQDPLFSSIPSRASNRKPYQEIRMSEREIENFVNSEKEIGSGKIFFVHEKKQRERAAKILNRNLELLFEIRKLHSFFYSHINWGEQENTKKFNGFPVETLEIPKEGLALFRLMGSWNVASFFRIIRLPSLLASSNTKVFSKAGAFGIIVFPSDDTDSILTAGRFLERTWLKATQMGFQFHVFGIPSLLLEVKKTPSIFSKKQVSKIETMDSELLELFGVQNGYVLAAFRIGRGDEPSGRTKRLPPEIKFL